MTTPDRKTVNICFRLPKDLDARLRAAALVEGISVSRLLVRAVSQSLDDEPPPWFTRWKQKNQEAREEAREGQWEKT